MENNSFADSANYQQKKRDLLNRKSLHQILNSLSQTLDIEFGSLTVHFHKGKCSPKIEIKKNIIQIIE